MWDRKEIKRKGKVAFRANYWRSVLCALIITLIAGGSAVANGSRSANQQDQSVQDAFNSMSDQEKSAFLAIVAGFAAAGFVIFIVYTALKIFVFNPLLVGSYGFFRENAGNAATDLGVIRTGFDNYKGVVITMFLRDLFTALWFCLFIIPGCVKIYSYRMVPFIIRDNPDLSWKEAITMSRQMMNGNKWATFVFDLSYIGWYILGAITCNVVNILWTEPYRQNANAILYRTLIGEEGHYGGPFAGGPYSGGPKAGGPYDGFPTDAYAPDAPVAPVPPLVPEAPTAPEAPLVPKTPDVMDAEVVPEVSVVPEAPVMPEAPITPEPPAQEEPIILGTPEATAAPQPPAEETGE